MKQVEFVVPTRLGREMYEVGDRKSFEDMEAAQYVKWGWAKDVATGEVGQLTPGSNGPIVPNKIVQQV